jgi:hypothetical protein
MSERIQLILKLITSHFLLTLLIITVSFFIKDDGYLTLSISQTIVLIMLLSGYWEFFSTKFKFTYFLLCEVLILTSLINRFVHENSLITNNLLIFTLITIQLFLVYHLTKIILVIFKKERESIEIEFPLKNGSYKITDGGNSQISRLMNYHFHSKVHRKRKTNRSMLFATDVVKFDKTSKKFFPLLNEDYPIFNEKIYSPYDGIVFKVINNIPDNLPFCGNYPYNTGNTVVIKNKNIFILLGHLKMNSIIVKEGDSVMKGDGIAYSGNSGYSERPHLHFQFIKCETEDYWKGIGINVTFNQRNLYKNRLINN